ncbi:glycosyl transferase family protein [Azospirillum sp. ST 5-10]|uniref:glycosyl transferase family protein n=1 Tax=unclassified Azospirillum TaxID=2630922 RepID=UPI003F4A0061
MTKSTEHPFAQYVRILGKGPTLSRSLTEEETYAAVSMILRGEVEPIQLGAFLCLIRVKTETPEELAGFARAARDSLSLPADPPLVDLDWPSYAGKSRRLPWFLLSALLLAENGVRVFMHGTEGHTAGRLFTGAALEALGVPVARSLDEAAAHLAARRFAYLRLADMAPKLHGIVGLKAVLGLRNPMHTVARMLNPFGAPCQMVGVAHPPYREAHQKAAALIGQPNLAVFKGEGGEAERRPEKPCEVFTLADGALGSEVWPPFARTTTVRHDDELDAGRLGAVWNGSMADAEAVDVVVATAAVALKTLGRARSHAEAETLAAELWRNRDTAALAGAA